MLYLKKACMNRAVGVSAANEQSSRSHFIFTIHVTWKHALTKARYSGKINLVDLAGSERLKIDGPPLSHFTSAGSLQPSSHFTSGTSDYTSPHAM